MQNYAKRIPVDQDGGKMVNSPPNYPALAATTRENGSTSSVTSLNPNTTVIEVASTGVSVGIRWATNQATSVQTAASVSSVGNQNYDSIIPPNTVRTLVVPRFQQGTSSIAGANVQEGLYPAIATISGGIGSVLLTQY